ncbi:hypothetical protein [Slackia isoflavoniconvertens]
MTRSIGDSTEELTIAETLSKAVEYFGDIGAVVAARGRLVCGAPCG